MKNPFLAKLPRTLILLLIAFISAIIIDVVFTEWPVYYKIIVPGIFIVISIFNLLPRKQTSENTPTTTEKPKKENNLAGMLMGKLIYFTAVVGLFFLLALMIKALYNDYQEIKNMPETKIVSSNPIRHDNPYRPSEDFYQYIHYDVVTDVFQVKKNQHWEWNFEYDVAYRILYPNGNPNQPFEKLIKKEKNWLEIDFVATHNGTLQIISLEKGKANLISAILYVSIFE